MSTVQTTSNKEIVRRFHDAVNSEDDAVVFRNIDALVEPEAVIRSPVPLEVRGSEAMKVIFATLRRGFPDLHVQVEDLIAEADKVVSRNTVTGTHQGEYMGLQPTGRSVTYNEIFIIRFGAGRIAETWGVVDVLSQLRQLGVTP
jgi:predicted ester cyclase